MTTLIESLDPAADAVVAPAFGRSETFHPRYGWLKKAFDAAAADEGVFLRDDATTFLGVGKNMVRAIRYWGLAYKILEEVPNPERPRFKNVRPTAFGRALLSDDGWDPYLEDIGSLWLLHWKLLSPPCLAPAWFATFNAVRNRELTDDTLLASLRLFCDARPQWGEVAESSLQKDARCMLRMYASVTAGRDLPEDTVDSPFTQLALIDAVRGAERFFLFNPGAKPSLPDAIVAFASLDFIVREGRTSAFVALSRLVGAAGGPGNAFKLPEGELGDALERYAAEYGTIHVAHAAGIRQVEVKADPAEMMGAVLARYYSAPGPRRDA